MDIQRAKYDAFVRRLPDVVYACLKVRVTLDLRASIIEPSGKRYVTVYECEVRNLTYAFNVIASGTTPYVVMQVPKMLPDGTFLVKGKRRVVMLYRRRANVPVMLSENVMAVNGGKLSLTKRTYTPSFGVKGVPIDKADQVKMDPAVLRLACRVGAAFAFDADDVRNIRIWTVDRLLETLIRNILLATPRNGRRWPEQNVTVAIFSAMATGNWRGVTLTGVTQLANFTNRTALRSQLRTVVSLYSNVQGRYVHSSTCKYFCVSETPEGQKVGLVHQLVEGVSVSDEQPRPAPTAGDMPWFHNGELVGSTGPMPNGIAHHGTVGTWSDAGRLTAGSDFLGRTARAIPFLNHNQGPRISYYCSMAKQAMGDSGPHQLLYCQRPMVSPCHEVTEGCNVILAINCMGYNQEDALVASKGSLERGLFRSIQWNVYHSSGKCNHLAAGQQVPAGTEIMPGVFTAKRGAAVSTITEAAESEDSVRITMGAMRCPVRGDKLCSRHGQKGVIGLIVPDEDMPYTADGIRPDLVINTHAFPSRMTVGQIMEMAGGKISGGVDGTAFQGQTMEDLYARGGSGRETMYSGTTGLPLAEKIFIAPCWYQRLCHLAEEKCYARGKTGLTDRVTNQPTAGRKNSGGMRLGEMERDVLLGSGATQIMRERMDCIGTVPWQTCTVCGKHLCHHIYGGRKTISEVPHATQLLAMELAAMGIEMELHNK